MNVWTHPHGSRARRVVFQIHLWVGVALGAYACVIGVTGAALMFRADLQAWQYPEVFSPSGADGSIAALDVVIEAARQHYPNSDLSGIDYPTGRRGTFLVYVREGRTSHAVLLHPSSGRFIGELPPRGWIQQLQELHFNLLGGETGEAISSAGAWGLLVLCLSGLFIWWPGPAQWRRGFLVDWRWGWKRIARDLHRATGVWVFLLMLMWAATGIHFTTPGLARQIIGAFAPFTYRPSIERDEPSPGGQPLPVSAIVARAQQQFPGAAMARVMFAARPTDFVGVAVARKPHGDWGEGDEATMWFDQFSGELLRTDRGWQAESGDVAVRWIGMLHVGAFGGWPLKVLWALGGLALPALFVTGYVMWWNRVLRRS